MRQILEYFFDDTYDDENDAEPPIPPDAGEIRIPILEDIVWYHCPRYHTSITTSAATTTTSILPTSFSATSSANTSLNYTNYKRQRHNPHHRPPNALSDISEQTWNEFWDEIDSTANLLAILTRLDIWFWLLLIPILILRAIAEIIDPNHEYFWDIFFWIGVFGVPLLLIGIDMYITYGLLHVDADQKIRDICIVYLPKFRLNGYHVEYRKELHRKRQMNDADDAADKSMYESLFYGTKPIVRFVRFRKLVELECYVSTSTTPVKVVNAEQQQERQQQKIIQSFEDIV